MHLSVGALETPAGRRRFISQFAPAARAEAEAEDAADPPADTVGDLDRMAHALRRRDYPSLELEAEVLAGEYHDTAAPSSASRALRWPYGAPR